MADRQCPIAGKPICGTTCLEISLWSDEIVVENDRSIYLEFIKEIYNYSKLELGLKSDVNIASKCRLCKYHWVDPISIEVTQFKS